MEKKRIVIIQAIKGSPTYKAGLRRGDVFIKVNEKEVTVDNFISLIKDVSTINVAYQRLTSSGTYEDHTASITRGSFTTEPVHYTAVRTLANGKKVGYFVYTTFLGSGQAAKLETVFSDFKTKGIDELIVDLRYNGGGYVSNAVLITNALVKRSVVQNKSLMFSYEYNAQITESLNTKKGNKDWNKVYFSPKDFNLDLNRVYFITTKSTASASELVINNLSPYINVITVGSKSYGKPVGSSLYEDKNEDHQYALLPITFRLKNAKGTSDYYYGILPTVRAEDGILRSYEDEKEASYTAAVNHILGGSTKAKTTPPAHTIHSDMPAHSLLIDDTNRL